MASSRPSKKSPKGHCGFFEIHAENYLVAGGPMPADLTRIAERYPLSIQGVGLSIGGEDPLDSGLVDAALK